MQFGIHLPQVGRKASADAITRAARQAEDLGFDSAWVNDHLAVPRDAPYPPSPSFFEPLITLTWAAAATSRIGLGTSVLVLPLRHPVHLAKEIATLDLLSGGRVVIGAGVGWLEGEFEALGVPYAKRGAWSDEAIAILRACWTEDPLKFEAATVPAKLTDIRTQPQPGRHIPIWIGGVSPAALRRAVRLGDGWHGTQLKPDDARPLVERLRGETGDGFVISMRRSWDPLEDDADALKAELAAYAEMGLDAVTMEPRQRGLDDWLKAVDGLAKLVEPWR